MPSEIITQVTFQSNTGLSKDRFVNDFHFIDTTVGGSLIDAAVGAAAMAASFYAEPSAAAPIDTVGQFMSSTLMPTGRIVCYDHAAAKPRPEVYVSNFTLAAPTGNPLPEEIALCLSYYAVRNIPSHRGRIYIGPLGTGALAPGASPPRPHTDFMTTLGHKGSELIHFDAPALVTALPLLLAGVPVGATPIPVTWCVYSPKLNLFDAITNGWIDDEWDGQSRRRVEATTRALFG